MSSDDWSDDIAEILDARRGASAMASGADHVRRFPELRELLEAADLAWESQQMAPPIADDSVAALLGLVPDPEMELNGTALSANRKRAGLTVNALAGKLAKRGWEITGKDIFAWENRRSTTQVPAIINALAEEIGADPDQLKRRARVDPERARLASVISSPTFRRIVERWARVQNTSVALASSALESRMLVAVHRGGSPDADVLLDALEAMVSAVEGLDDE